MSVEFYYNYKSKNGDFNYFHKTDLKPNDADFVLHNHNDFCEIMFFFRGNCEFRVEGSIYPLTPLDIIITHTTEMHKIVQKKPVMPYERAVLNIKKSFFIQNGCENFLDIFTKRPLGVNNIISANLVENRKIIDIIKDMDTYITENDAAIHTIMQAKLIDLLYNLNLIAKKSNQFNFANDKIKDIILYINDNISSDLSLSKISEHFFISKYHLCHIFKGYSGLTINKYITYKRIMKVREYVKAGWSLMDASMEAGFGNYSNFYKVYVKETGKSPKKDLKA